MFRLNVSLKMTLLSCVIITLITGIFDTYNRNFSCIEANYPYAIKNQRGASKAPRGGFGCDPHWMPELVLYGVRELA